MSSVTQLADDRVGRAGDLEIHGTRADFEHGVVSQVIWLPMTSVPLPSLVLSEPAIMTFCLFKVTVG